MGILDLEHQRRYTEAIKQAKIALHENEVPVGAVVVCENRIIARGYNQTEKLNDVTAHAEMLALTAAFNYLGSKYLQNCSLYVTLEPCIMCAGACYWSQINRLIFGTKDTKLGFTNKGYDILHPKTKVSEGILEDVCRSLLMEFFNKKRNN